MHTCISGIQWLSECIPYGEPEIKGDTFPMTWADDGHLYTSAGDPLWGEEISGLDVQVFTGKPPEYAIRKVNPMVEYQGWGGQGPKPSGMICVDGVLYLAAQNMLGLKPPAYGTDSQHGSDATILCSYDHGATWSPPRDAPPMFPGALFGGPAFINFGRNNAGARDEYIYAVSGDQWDNGSTLRLGRAPANEIMNRAAWEWVSGLSVAQHPAWSSCLEYAYPILTHPRAVSLPEMVYLAAVERYLLLTWRLHEDFSPDAGSDLYIYEAPEPWGPFTLVYEEEFWEGQEVNPYCPRLPLAWLEDDGLTGWLQFSGTWRDGGKTPYYRSNVRKFRLILK